ncbi:MAG TPA: HNH endonuclease [Longimicrobiales bacterium]|nr:HNH endonuclease [Longimicrobiales bacterium]
MTSRRERILKRDRYTCVYCAVEYPPAGLTIDHVQPRVKGGDDSDGNLVTCCAKCNQLKGGLAAWAFLAARPEYRENFLRLAVSVWPRLRRAVEETGRRQRSSR